MIGSAHGPAVRSSLVALASVALATAGTWVIYPLIAPGLSLLFFPAVLLAAMYGGYGAALLATILSTVSLAYLFVPPRQSFDIGIDDAIRLAAFAVVAITTAWLGSARRRAEGAQAQSVEDLREAVATLRQVSGWPVVVGPDAPSALRRMLTHAAAIVGAGSIVVAWERDDEPWLYVATPAEPTQTITRRTAPDDLRPLVAAPLENASFLSYEPRGEGPVHVSEGGGVWHWRGRPLHPGLAALLPAGSMMSAPFKTEHLGGRVFMADLTHPGAAAIPALEVVAREVGNSLDQLHVAERVRELAVREDRLRLSRDLHDGVLQALTGIRLELQSIADQPVDAESARHRLVSIERALATEQRELRMFIEELKPGACEPARSHTTASSIEQMCARLALEWKTPVKVDVTPTDLTVPPAIERAVRLMTHEAVVNALKHARPSCVAVAVDAAGPDLSVCVADDGRGFPIRGRFDHDALAAGNLGPVSLRERVGALSGRLTVDSTPAGSRVEFTLPMDVRSAG